MIESNIYKTTINGIAAKLKNNINNKENINILNCVASIWLEMFSLKFNFIENNFILLTINIESPIAIKHNETVEL